MIPSQPTLLDRPFCANGNKNTIPATNDGTQGLASLSLGFPPITEKPLTSGGVPPFRKDFNGIFNILSAFAFYIQSGGIFTYNANANYVTPAVVSYQGVLWFCKQENGVDSVNGVKTPNSTNSDYWVRLIDYILDQASRPVGTPIGTIIMWASSNSPADGGVWLDCNGQSCSAYPALVEVLGTNTVPDMRGLFPRCVGQQEMSVTINGVTTAQTFDGGSVGDKSADGIRNISGTFYGYDAGYVNTMRGDGSLFVSSGNAGRQSSSNGDARDSNYTMDFDASKVVPVATENKPVNISLRFLIKAE